MKTLSKKLSIGAVAISLTLVTTSLLWVSSSMGALLSTVDSAVNTKAVSVVQSATDNTSKMTTGDINGDAIADVVVLTRDNLSVLLGNGDGTFFDQVDTPFVTPFVLSENGQCWSMKGGVGKLLLNSCTIDECIKEGGKSWCRFAGSCDDL